MNDPSPPPSPRSALSRGLASWSWPCSSPGSSGPSGHRCGRSWASGRGIGGRSSALARCVRRLAVPEHAPGSRYVGDAACVRCHREIAEAYRSHPMGRSLAPIGGSRGGPADRCRRGTPVRVEGRAVHRRAPRRATRSTRRRGATRTGACSPRSRPKSATLSARGRAASPS